MQVIISIFLKTEKVKELRGPKRDNLMGTRYQQCITDFLVIVDIYHLPAIVNLLCDKKTFAIFVMRTNALMEEKDDIVIYNSEDGLVKIEAVVAPAGETIWSTQKAIAALFGVTGPNISYHLGRIFRIGELDLHKREDELRSFNPARFRLKDIYEDSSHYLS